MAKLTTQFEEILGHQEGCYPKMMNKNSEPYGCSCDIGRLIQAVRERDEQIKKLLSHDIGAVPNSTDYANGWNDARHKEHDMVKKPIRALMEESL